MGDEERRNFILLNLKKLTTFTVIGTEFVVSLLSSGLVDDSESYILLDTQIPPAKRLFKLYNESAKKWNLTQFEAFKRVLQETKNVTALQVFSDYETNSKTTPPTTLLVPRNVEEVPNIKPQSQLKRTNQQFNRPEKINNEAEKLNIDNNESRTVEDPDQFVKTSISVRDIVTKLDSSSITTSKSENNANGRTKKTKIELANEKEGGQMNSLPSSSSSSVLVKSGQINVPKLLKRVSIEDLNSFIYKKEVAWNLVRTFSQYELYSLISNEETRVCDKFGWPVEVSVCLGEELVPRGVQLAEFRGKCGKTVFELDFGGRDFALKVLWGDLLREMEEFNDKGPVTVALREATGRFEGGGCSGWKLIQELEGHVKSMITNICSKPKQNSFVIRNNGSKVKGFTGIRARELMNWVTEGVQLWNEKEASTPFKALPFFVRYSQNVTPTRLRNILRGNNREELKKEANLISVLRSLIILSSKSYQDDKRCFFEVAAFLEENFQFIPPHLMLLTQRVILFLANDDMKDVPNSNKPG